MWCSRQHLWSLQQYKSIPIHGVRWWKSRALWQNTLSHCYSLWWRWPGYEHWYHTDKPLESAVFTRLFGIGVPELAAIHYVKTDDLQHVYAKRLGHLQCKPLCSSPFPEHVCSLWNSSILWRNSSGGNGHPPDFYGRPLKEFWFKYTKPPSDKMEATFLEFVEQLVSNQPELRKRLMSPFSVHNATAISPFLLSLNALLVVTGFCHVFTRHCQDKLLLGLQEVAKENKMGPIWCGASQNFIHGWKSDNNGDYILKHFIQETTMNLERKLRISLQEVQWVSPLAQERNDETDLLQPNYQSTGSRPPSSTFTWERTPVWHLRDHKVRPSREKFWSGKNWWGIPSSPTQPSGWSGRTRHWSRVVHSSKNS